MFFLTNIFKPKHTLDLPEHGNLIEVPVRLENGSREIFTSFALDTGATFTVVEPSLIRFLEIEPRVDEHIEVVTASGTEQTIVTTIPRLNCLGLIQTDTPTIITPLPQDSGVTGLLGLSFLRHYRVQLDFKRGQLRLR